MVDNLDKLWFSQASLSAWLSCSLKFKYRYIDGLYWPVAVGGKVGEHMEMGRRFHMLAQEYYSHGRVNVPQGNKELEDWTNALTRYLPWTESRRFFPEYDLRGIKDGIKLLSKYDLLVTQGDGVVIYDWKTDANPPRQSLITSPQTRLYMYLLCLIPKQLGASPDKIRMVYWNPRFPKEPLSLGYSSEQMEEDATWIARIVQDIRQAKDYPPTDNQKNCQFCEYRPVCHGQGIEDVEMEEIELGEVNWDEIEEIALQGVSLP